MNNMKKIVLAVALVCSSIATAPASAQVSFAVSTPGLSIGVNVPSYPQLVPVPGYPVYYAPQLNSNYFFYDGLYWVYSNDIWYESTWYNGPWSLVEPEVVPVFILRVPVRYYRRPPTYFRAWDAGYSPRWGEHWGNSWEDQRRGWDNWDRRAAPRPAPLPVYQRQYSGNRYPHVEQQRTLESQNYRYTPRDPQVQQRFQAQRAPEPSRTVNQAERPQGQNQRPMERPMQAMPPPDYSRQGQQAPAQRQSQQPAPHREAQQPRPERQAQQPTPQQQQTQAQQPMQQKQPRQAQQPTPDRQAQQPRPERQAQQPRPEPEAQGQQPQQRPQQARQAPPPLPPQASQQAREQVAQQRERPPQSRGEQNKGEGKGKGRDDN